MIMYRHHGSCIESKCSTVDPCFALGLYEQPMSWSLLKSCVRLAAAALDEVGWAFPK